jgi:hypothetical protein
MNKHNPDYIRSLSDAVLKTAQDVVEGSVTDRGWQTLIEAGLELRRLANLPLSMGYIVRCSQARNRQYMGVYRIVAGSGKHPVIVGAGKRGFVASDSRLPF